MSNDHYTPSIDALPLFSTPAPSVRGSATSAAAADSLAPQTLNRLHRLVLEYLREHGPATDEEIAAGLAMNPSTARPRRIELVRRGMVVEAGVRKTASGRHATAWRFA
jgi:predicted ArsR family transcriptional regulator